MIKLKTSFEMAQTGSKTGWKPRKFSNVSKLDTNGFMPLEVQIKRYLLAGARLQAYRDQFSSEDYLEAYKDIPTITSDMDFTEIKEVVDKINLNLQERLLMKQNSAESSPQAVREAEEPKKGSEDSPQPVREVSAESAEGKTE